MAKATNTIPCTFEIKIKDRFKSKQFGYNGSIEPLEKRNDLHMLMDYAINSQAPNLIEVFESMPTEEEWLAVKEALYLSQNP